jgi:probable F420-dependent oxidoreductase
MAVRISTGLPNCREGRQNLMGSVSREGMERSARLAESLGYHALWPNEFIATDPPVAARYATPPNLYDTIVTISFVAAVTSRIRIIPSTIVLPLHEPLLLSRQLATLDVFSGGRITLGIGLGGSAEEYRRLHGEMQKPNRGQMMDEYLLALRALWSDRHATFQGKYVSITDVEAFPKPLQDPLPIFVAGNGEAMLKRAANSEGWIEFGLQPEEMRSTIAQLQAYREEAGRQDEPFEIARQFYISVAPTEAEAKANFAAAMPPPDGPGSGGGSGGSGAPPAWEHTLVGTPERIASRLAEYVETGVTEICAIFYSPDDESTERQTRLFAAEVMPQLGVTATAAWDHS